MGSASEMGLHRQANANAKEQQIKRKIRSQSPEREDDQIALILIIL